jgi:AcrR family transcriptional regulator
MARPSISGESLGLRERLIEAASKIFVEEGYQNLSMRRVAQEVGCSQMATYRHFANKEALTQHICSQLYTSFAAKMKREIEAVSDPWERCRRFVAALIRFAVNYPDHYSQIFLVRHSDPIVLANRERLGQQFLADFHPIVKALLPPSSADALVVTRLRQMFCCLHGTAALLIAHPKAYRLTKRKAIGDVEETLLQLFERQEALRCTC